MRTPLRGLAGCSGCANGSESGASDLGLSQGPESLNRHAVVWLFSNTVVPCHHFPSRTLCRHLATYISTVSFSVSFAEGWLDGKWMKVATVEVLLLVSKHVANLSGLDSVKYRRILFSWA